MEILVPLPIISAVKKEAVMMLFLPSIFTIVFSLSLFAQDDYINFAADQLLSDDAKILKCFFVPQPKSKKNDVKRILLGLVEAEQERIDAALFRLNDTELAYALCQAKSRGVNIVLVLDWSAFADRSNKIDMVQEAGISVYKYSSSATMHNKFFIFHDNLWNKRIVWTGSANATLSGLSRNEENVIITDHEEFVYEFKKRFAYLVEQVKEQKEPKKVSNEKIYVAKPYMAGLVPPISYQHVHKFFMRSWQTIIKLAAKIH